MPLKFDQKKMNAAVAESRIRKKVKKEFNKITEEGQEAGIEWLEAQPGRKIEVYFPNITREEVRIDAEGNPVIDEEGNEVIDTVADVEIYRKHQFKRAGDKGFSFAGEKRCVSGIHYEDDEGNVLLDGKCPICAARYEYELEFANKRIKQECAAEGLDPKKDAKNPRTKEIVKKWLSKTLISKPTEYVLVPFYFIETEPVKNKAGKTVPQPVFQKDENGEVITNEEGMPIPVFHRYVRRMAIKTFNQMKENAEAMEYDGAFGNRWSLKFGDGDKMNAGKEMQLVCLGGPKNDKAAKMFEYLDADARVNMTPDKLRDYVVDAQIYSKEELQEVAAKIVEPTVKALALLKTEEALAESTAEDMASDLADMGVEVD